MRITRLNHIMKEDDEVGSALAVRWLIGPFIILDDILVLTLSKS